MAMLMAVVSTAPTMALPPKKGPSGLALMRFDWNLYTEYAKAPARGKLWSLENKVLRKRESTVQQRAGQKAWRPGGTWQAGCRE
eukprot:scaffold276_cov19-Tisochrysis_lutea.AAC.2